jgi:hypothetical protein
VNAERVCISDDMSVDSAWLEKSVSAERIPVHRGRATVYCKARRHIAHRPSRVTRHEPPIPGTMAQQGSFAAEGRLGL